MQAIHRVDWNSSQDEWQEKVNQLAAAKRILVVCGQESYVSDEQQRQMTEFFHKFNSAIAVDYMSNIECEGTFNPSSLHGYSLRE